MRNRTSGGVRGRRRKSPPTRSEKMSRIDDYEATSKAAEDLKILGQIYRKDMGEFLDFLADENGKSFGRLCENNFDEILSWLK